MTPTYEEIVHHRDSCYVFRQRWMNDTNICTHGGDYQKLDCRVVVMSLFVSESCGGNVIENMWYFIKYICARITDEYSCSTMRDFVVGAVLMTASASAFAPSSFTPSLLRSRAAVSVSLFPPRPLPTAPLCPSACIASSPLCFSLSRCYMSHFKVL